MVKATSGCVFRSEGRPLLHCEVDGEEEEGSNVAWGSGPLRGIPRDLLPGHRLLLPPPPPPSPPPRRLVMVGRVPREGNGHRKRPALLPSEKSEKEGEGATLLRWIVAVAE